LWQIKNRAKLAKGIGFIREKDCSDTDNKATVGICFDLFSEINNGIKQKKAS